MSIEIKSANLRELGDFVSAHKAGTSRFWAFFFFSFIGTIFWAAVFVVVCFFILKMADFDWRVFSAPIVYWRLPIFLIPLNITTILFVRLLMALTRKVDLFQNGIILNRYFTGKLYYWDDVKFVFMNNEGKITLRLQFFDKSSVLLDGDMLTDMNLLSSAILANVSADQLSKALHSLASNQRVDFETLHVNREGFFIAKDFLAWDKVQKIEVSSQNQRVAIWKAGEPKPWFGEQALWYSMEYKHFPNVTLFMAILDHLRGNTWRNP